MKGKRLGLLTGNLVLLAWLFVLGGCGNDSTQTVTLSQSSQEALGKALFFDTNLSSPVGQSCASCHDPSVGFTGPNSTINTAGAVMPGAISDRFGNRKPPSAAYATQSPLFHFDNTDLLFLGGNFWDGRATGDITGSPAADQALMPFLNPVEMNLASAQALCDKVAAASYAPLFNDAFPDIAKPLDCVNDVTGSYHRIGLAIAAFEASKEVNAFSSKYDYYLRGKTQLTAQELQGLNLFQDPAKGNCSACHPSALGPNGELPLFTDYSFDNLGVPKNLANPVYTSDPAFIDKGLGGYLETLSISNPGFAAMATENMGKQKVPTLRNLDKRPNALFVKAYTHNGYFKTLKEIVHFYNSRDALPVCTGTDTRGATCWAAAEVPATVNNTELGNLGLTDAEEDAIVAFLKTLTDGYTP